jgi:hypothetical protein
MLTVRRNLNGWEWSLVDETGFAWFCSKWFSTIASYMLNHNVDAVRVEVEPGEFLEMDMEMMDGMTEAAAKNIIIA